MKHYKKTNHRLLFSFAMAVILLCSMSIVGISSYFVAARKAVNSATIGHSSVVINENFENPDIEPLKTTVISKQVSVENVGPNPCSVRVKASFSDESVLSYADIDYDTAHWTLSDGYWYYNSVLAPNDGEDDDNSLYETTPLMKKITLNKPTADQIKDFDVYIYAESRNCQLTDNPMSVWK